MGYTKEQFGMTHRNFMLYCESRAVDNRGVLDMKQVSSDPAKDAARFDDGSTAEGYTEMDCLDDFEREGLLRNIGTGGVPRVVLTDDGWTWAWELRKARAERMLAKSLTPEFIESARRMEESLAEEKAAMKAAVKAREDWEKTEDDAAKREAAKIGMARFHEDSFMQGARRRREQESESDQEMLDFIWDGIIEWRKGWKWQDERIANSPPPPDPYA